MNQSVSYVGIELLWQLKRQKGEKTERQKDEKTKREKGKMTKTEKGKNREWRMTETQKKTERQKKTESRYSDNNELAPYCQAGSYWLREI